MMGMAMLSIVVLSVSMTRVAMLIVFMLSVVMTRVAMLSDIVPNLVMLSVSFYAECHCACLVLGIVMLRVVMANIFLQSAECPCAWRCHAECHCA
jgi:hypothetical protein